MKPESIILTVTGICFGVILGWVLATLDAGRTPTVPTAAAAPAQVEPPPGNDREPTAELDEARVQSLTTILTSDPNNAGAAAQLAETYFRAERMDDAIKWYKEALRLDPRNVEASTQLGMSYFVVQGADAALAQFEQSLKMAPDHPRTLLSKGIVLWQGKRDLDGAAAAWKRIVQVAPSSPEAEAAQQGLQAINKDGHGDDTPAAEQ